MTRDTLPHRRESVNFTLEFQGERYHVTTGFYADGNVGEIFINRIRDKSAAKLGQQLDAVCRDSAILMSLALQHDVNLNNLKHSITRDDDGVPMSIIGAIVDSVNPKEKPDDREPARLRGPDSTGGAGAAEKPKEARTARELTNAEIDYLAYAPRKDASHAKFAEEARDWARIGAHEY